MSHQLTLPRRTSAKYAEDAASASAAASAAESNLSELPSLLSRLRASPEKKPKEEEEAMGPPSRPVGMDALESVYAPMRNLSRPLIPAALKTYGQQRRQEVTEATSQERKDGASNIRMHCTLFRQYKHDIHACSWRKACFRT